MDVTQQPGVQVARYVDDIIVHVSTLEHARDHLDAAQCAPLFSAMKKDEMQKYVYQYKPQQLGNPDQVN